MSKDLLFYGWNKAVPGREKAAGKLFQEYLQWLGGLQQAGTIDSFESVLLTAHGGDLNGFVLIRGDIVKLDEVRRTDEFNRFITLAGHILEGGGLVSGATGAGVMEWMARWTSLLEEVD